MGITPEHAEIKRLHEACQHKDAVIRTAIEAIQILLEKWARPEMPDKIRELYNELINNFKDEIG